MMFTVLIDVSVSLSGGFVVKPRNVVKFTASSTETSGVRPAAGRKPVNASSTEQRKNERKNERKRRKNKD